MTLKRTFIIVLQLSSCRVEGFFVLGCFFVVLVKDRIRHFIYWAWPFATTVI